MRLGILAIFPLLLCSLAVSQDPGFSIAIGHYSPTISSGSELKIPIVLTNKSDKLIYVGKAIGGEQAELNYLVEVTDSNGQPAVRTNYGQSLISPNTVRTTSELQYPLQPGQSLEDCLVVTRIYDLSRPGRYTIQVRRDGIKSSPAHVTVN